MELTIGKTKRVVTIFTLLYSGLAVGEWSLSPEPIIIGAWGGEDNQFGISHQDSGDLLPGAFDVSISGHVVMADEVNGRFKIYNEDHSLAALVTPPVDRPEMWVINPIFIGDNISLILDEFYIYDLSGRLVSQNISPKKARFRKDVDGVLYMYQDKPLNQWATFSPTGELLNTYHEAPLIIGRVHRNLLIYNQEKVYRTEVIYDNGHFSSMEESARFADYLDRDKNGNIYSIQDRYKFRQVVRYNQCGKPMATLKLPVKDVVEIPSGMPGVEGQWIYNSVYYTPKIDMLGNVYATRRTPDNYSLVKWTWQDSASDKNEGPDAPINLTATDVSVNSVTVTWEGSLQDPGCVTGYQLLRSDAQSGPYHVVAEIYKGNKTAKDSNVEAGNIYYYQIKALSSISDSAPSDAIKIEIPKE